ncbi:hypothetical protein EV702DRAFT_1052007 [Suillus placidus]|uniref:Uncharacterized protein n=1 Tax=Suillus placidus TaxID=48579 RepID=A0A9P6ZFD4_9AGAM|nr:hypothetical protein EV702DRAFT_1052007 [Suillus placidus]
MSEYGKSNPTGRRRRCTCCIKYDDNQLLKRPLRRRDSGSTRNEDAELIDCQKVSAIDFLEYLFGKTFWSRLVEGKTAFQHASINFSHWVPMSEFISIKLTPIRRVLDALPKSGLCDTGIAQARYNVVVCSRSSTR